LVPIVRLRHDVSFSACPPGACGRCTHSFHRGRTAPFAADDTRLGAATDSNRVRNGHEPRTVENCAHCAQPERHRRSDGAVPPHLHHAAITSPSCATDRTCTVVSTI